MTKAEQRKYDRLLIEVDELRKQREVTIKLYGNHLHEIVSMSIKFRVLSDLINEMVEEIRS